MKDYSNYYPSFEELIIDNGKMIFEQQLQSFEGKDILIDNKIKTKALVRYHSNPLNEEKEDRKLTCWKDTPLKIGSYVKILDEDAHYIVFTRIKENDLVKYTKIIYCNHVLTIQDRNTSEIHHIPCYAGDKTSVYSTGLDKNKQLIFRDDQIIIIVQENEITKNIEPNKRIIFKQDKNNIYKITRDDNLTYDGIISFRAERDEYDPAIDNLELNIANYIEPEEPTNPTEPTEPTEPTQNYTIELENNYESLVFGLPVEFTATVYQDDQQVDKQVKFKIIKNPHLAWIEIDENNPNKCCIYGNKENNAGDVTLKVSLIDDESIYIEREYSVGSW